MMFPDDLPPRVQSPVGGNARPTHPGAVLLTSPQMSSASLLQGLVQDDFSSPMVVPPVRSPLLSSLNYLDDYTNSRPVSSMSNAFEPSSRNVDVLSFSNDLNHLINWVALLNTTQQTTVIDHLFSVLSDETLQYARLKLDGFAPPVQAVQSPPHIASPMPSRILTQSQHEPLTLDSVLNGERAWSPAPVPHTATATTFASHLEYDFQRPRSADPYKPHASSHLSQTLHSAQGHTVAHSAVHNAVHSAAQAQQTQQAQGQHTPRRNEAKLNIVAPKPRLQETPKHKKYSEVVQPVPQRETPTSVPGTPVGQKSSMNAKVLSDMALLEDLPTWLKSLRLHKYTPMLQHVPWRELITYDDAKLEECGVGALGARRKLLKAFELVAESI